MARIREIEQSRVGLSAQIVRINTKYRTCLARVKVKLYESSEWPRLSKMDQIQKEKDLKAGLDAEEEQEFTKAAETWIELTNMDAEMDSDGGQTTDKGVDADSESSWGGINNDDDSMNESDSQFDDGDNPSENEALFDENGNQIQAEDLAEGIKGIFTRHVRQLMQTLKKYEVIEGEGSSGENRSRIKNELVCSIHIILFSPIVQKMYAIG